MNQWKVYVCDPPKSGKNGANFVLVAKGPGPGGTVVSKRKSSGTSERVEAERRAAGWLLEIEHTMAPLTNDPTVGQVLERHLAHVETDSDVSPATVDTYRAMVRRLVPILGAVKSSALSRDIVLDAVRQLREGTHGKPLKGSTIKLTLRRARDAWGWAVEREVVKRPWPRLKRRDVRARKTEYQPFSDAEVELVLAWIAENRPAWTPYFRLMAATGMRAAEVCSLNGADVRRDALEVRFRDAKSKEPTGAPVPAEVMNLLPHVGPDAPVFLRDKGSRATPHAANQIIRKAIAALGPKIVDGHLKSQHSFKRSMVDALHRNGVDLATAMRVTRHKTAGVHLDYQRNGTGHDVRAAQARVIEARRAAASSMISPRVLNARGAPLTGPLTESGAKSSAGMDQNLSTPNRSRS